jgi:DNA topoisomerase IB
MRDDLTTDGLTRTAVLACAVRLLDLGFFRIGGEQYASENQSYGLATLLKEHVTVSTSTTATSRSLRVHRQERQAVGALAGRAGGRAVVKQLKQRRGGGPELLAYRSGPAAPRAGSTSRAATSTTTCAASPGGTTPAKDFRTWSATVMAAVGLAVSTHAESPTARKRAVTRVVKEVAEKLGNTPAVCRASYIDPRIIDLYDHRVTIAPQLEALGDEASYGSPAFQGAIEQAVLSLLREPEAQQLAV